MKFLYSAFLFLTCLVTQAQNNYTIQYTVANGVVFDSAGKGTFQNKIFGTLFISSDTLSFFKYSLSKPKQQKKVFVNDKESHHGTLHYLKTDSLYEVSTAFENNYLISLSKRDLSNTNWTIYTDTMNILGYTCTKAVNDSGTVAWFTKDLPSNIGPLYYYGLPGLILDLIDTSLKTVITADQIRQENIQIILPKKWSIISLENYQRQRKAKQHGNYFIKVPKSF